MGGDKQCPARFHPTIGVTIIYQPCLYFIGLCYILIHPVQDIHYIIENIVLLIHNESEYSVFTFVFFAMYIIM